MKTILLLFLTVFALAAFGQTNVDFYKIEKEGDRLLVAGRFDDAIEAYAKYKIISNGRQVPEIDRKIAEATAFLPVYNEGLRFFAAGKFIQAIDKFQQYRKLFPGLSIRSIDTKIEQGLVQMERRGNLNALAAKDKVIFGFEKNYLAGQALEEGEFDKAMELYRSALQNVKNLKEGRTVVSEANQRISQINKCRNISNGLENVTDPAKRIALLESYKAEGGLVVKPFERKIDEIRLGSEGVVRPPDKIVDVDDELNRIADKCNIKGVLAFLRNTDPKLFRTAPRDSIYDRLQEIYLELSEVREISLNGDNEHRERFVFGGYENLIGRSMSVPVIGGRVKSCIQKEYFSYLYKSSQEIYARDMNLMNAREIAINARDFAVSAEEKAVANDLIAKINRRIGCDPIIGNVTALLNTIDANLGSCKSELAKSNFEKMLKLASGCATSALETRIADTRKRIASLETRLTRDKALREAINSKLANADCAGIGYLIAELENLNLCDPEEMRLFASGKRREAGECERKEAFRKQVSMAIRQLDQINTSQRDLRVAEKELLAAGKMVRDAELIATRDDEDDIEPLKEKADAVGNRIRNEAERRRRERRRNYDHIIKPEIYAAYMVFAPKIWSGDDRIATAQTTSGNYEAGLNLRFLKRGAVFGSAVGLHYMVNDFQILDKNQSLSEQVKAEYLNLEYRITTGFKKNSHPYLGVAVGVSQPIKVKYEDLVREDVVETSYFQKNNYVKTRLFTGLFVGYEGHRQNMGFSIEGFVRISGLLEDDTSKETLLPLLKDENFRFGTNAAKPFNSSAVSYGLALTFHLW